MEFADVIVNKTCCNMINQLLVSLNCLSCPISELQELYDGSVLVEIIENFESAFGMCNNNDGNYSFIKKWLTKQGIFLGRGRSVDEILTGGQLAHLAMLCYAMVGSFISNQKHLKRKFANYSFAVDDRDMIEIALYTKWKLCEEEVQIKENLIKSKQKYEINSLKNDNCLLRGEIMELRNKIVEMQNDEKKKEEEHKMLVARLIAELSVEKFKQREEQLEYKL